MIQVYTLLRLKLLAFSDYENKRVDVKLTTSANGNPFAVLPKGKSSQGGV